jgi:hypothetical protein
MIGQWCTLELMAIAGVVLLLLGFMLVAPRGATAGSTAARNVGMRGGAIFRTPGYQAEPSRRARVWTVSIGVTMLVVGVTLIVLGT